MLKIFVTGDNHIGKAYHGYPGDVREKLIQSRFDCLRDMVKEAEREGCGLFVVTGDLFDDIEKIKKNDVKQVVEILAVFSGTVLILPGNHDYYTGDEKVWKDFEEECLKRENDIILLKKFEEYPLEIGEEKVVIYPAFCNSKHSENNNLAWIKETDIESERRYKVGIAHGAIKGVTPDTDEKYFLMTESELKDIPVDVWLIGHTHIPYPRELQESKETTGYKIFNAGTHEQTAFGNNTEGCCFVITLDKVDGKTNVSARKFISGKIRFFDLSCEVKADAEDSLRRGLEEKTKEIGNNSVVRVNITGTAKPEEYADREKIYRDVLDRFVYYYKPEDKEFSKEITVEKIRSEYSELSFAAQFMEKLIESPVELQMAYELINKCRE